MPSRTQLLTKTQRSGHKMLNLCSLCTGSLAEESVEELDDPERHCRNEGCRGDR